MAESTDPVPQPPSLLAGSVPGAPPSPRGASTIHPAFDLATRTWYVEGWKREFRTLAELQSVHPKRVIVGYAPEGYRVPPWPKDPAPARRSFDATPRPQQWGKPRRPHCTFRAVGDPVARRELILSLWATSDITINQVAERAQCSPSLVSSVITQARKNRDPRAVYRMMPSRAA